MTIKKFAVAALLLTLSVFAIGAASAQGNPGRGENRPPDFLRNIAAVIEEETGLTGQEIRTELHNGNTLAAIIESNGGDVNAVISVAIENITTQVNEAVANERITQARADDLLADLETHVTDAVNGEGIPGQFRDRFNQRRGQAFQNAGHMALLRATSEATDLGNAELAAAIRDSETLAAVIESNGATVDEVIAAAATSITERINEAVANERMTQGEADEMLSNLETTLTEMVNTPIEELRGRPGGNRPGANNGVRRVVNAVAEATGLENTAIVEQLQAGNSLASILTDNDVDVASFVDEQLAEYSARLAEQVEAGRISQELADARLNLRRVELTEALNRVPEAPATDTDAQA